MSQIKNFLLLTTLLTLTIATAALPKDTLIRNHKHHYASMPKRQSQPPGLTVNVGTTGVEYSTNRIDDFIITSLVTLCGDVGCDSGRNYNEGEKIYFFKDFDDGKVCTLSASAEGNYDSTEDRDYLINALAKSIFTAGTGKTIKRNKEDTTALCNHQSGSEVCGLFDVFINDGPNFAQAVLNELPGGANRASMSVKVQMDCQDSSFGIDCPSVVTENIKDALSAIPPLAIGAPQIIDVLCK